MEIQTNQVNQMSTGSGSQDVHTGDEHKNQPTKVEIQDWLVSYLGKLLSIDPDKIDVTTPLDSYCLDSLAAVGLIGELEDWLLIELDPGLLYDYSTIEALAQHLAEVQLENAEQMLAKLDRLTDEEVDALLTSILSK